MLFVLLTILSSLAISLILKYNEARDGDRLTVAGSNYVSAALLGYLFSSGTAPLSPGWIGAALAVGAGFVGGFLLLMRSIRATGLAVPISVARIATLGPVLLSIVIYGEQPGPTEIAGVGLGLLAFLLLGFAQRIPPAADRRSTFDIGAILLLASLFLMMVANDFAMKVVQANGVDEGTFLLLLFGAAAVICWGAIALRLLRGKGGNTFRARDAALGLLLGIPNYFSSYFLIRGLDHLPASTVFPIVSAAGVVAASLAAVLLWRERPSRPAWIGIALAAVAVALLGS